MNQGRRRATLTEGEPAVVVEADGLVAPTVFTSLSDALAALWSAMRLLPLDDLQMDAYRYFLTRPDAAERVAEFLARDGRLDLTFSLGGRSSVVKVRPVREIEG